MGATMNNDSERQNRKEENTINRQRTDLRAGRRNYWNCHEYPLRRFTRYIVKQYKYIQCARSVHVIYEIEDRKQSKLLSAYIKRNN